MSANAPPLHPPLKIIDARYRNEADDFYRTPEASRKLMVAWIPPSED